MYNLIKYNIYVEKFYYLIDIVALSAVLDEMMDDDEVIVL